VPRARVGAERKGGGGGLPLIRALAGGHGSDDSVEPVRAQPNAQENSADAQHSVRRPCGTPPGLSNDSRLVKKEEQNDERKD